MVVYGGALPATVRRQFEIDLEDCREVRLEETKRVDPKYDPFRRPSEERNSLIHPDLLTEDVRTAMELLYGK